MRRSLPQVRLRAYRPRRPRHFTLWLESRDGRPKKVHVPVALLPVLAIAVTATVVLSVHAAAAARAHAQRLQVKAQQLQVAASAGAAAQDKLQSIQREVASQDADIQSALQTIHKIDGQIRAAAGIQRRTATAGLPKTNPAVRQVAAGESVLQDLSSSLPALSTDVQRLGKSLSDWTAQAAHTPSLWPVVGPITSPYGERPSPFNEGAQFHTGVDIGVPSGTQVHATAAGRVISAGWSTIYGNEVIIDNGGGLTTLYGHNERLLVHAGQPVAKGQVIADSGSTGWSTGPHVHYQVNRDGQPVNPAPYLPGYAEVARGGGESGVQTAGPGTFGYGGR